MAEETPTITTESKKWWQSRTIWSAIIGIAVIVAQLFGISDEVIRNLLGAAEESAVSGNVQLGTLLTAGAAFVVAIYGRIAAKKKIGSSTTDETQ